MSPEYTSSPAPTGQLSPSLILLLAGARHSRSSIFATSLLIAAEEGLIHFHEVWLSRSHDAAAFSFSPPTPLLMRLAGFAACSDVTFMPSRQQTQPRGPCHFLCEPPLRPLLTRVKILMGAPRSCTSVEAGCAIRAWPAGGATLSSSECGAFLDEM